MQHVHPTLLHLFARGKKRILDPRILWILWILLEPLDSFGSFRILLDFLDPRIQKDPLFPPWGQLFMVKSLLIISTVGVDDVRRQISVIPQNPVLFAGTIGTNLDQFDHYSDHEIWHALKQVNSSITRLLRVHYFK